MSSTHAGGPPAPRRSKPKCDLCMKKDGFMEMKCRTCIKCHVSVHEECYGLPATRGQAIRPDPNWECHACAAVGKVVLVSKKGEKMRTMKQETRPTDCALCPVVGGVHAMHKLYDTHGPNGVQRVLRADRKRNLPARLAWVHSICACGVSSSRVASGCVFGCMADGRYLGQPDDKDEDDVFSSANSSPSPTKKRKTGDSNSDEDDDGGTIGTVHHFVICHKENGEDTPYTNIIRECRELRCFLCGNDKCPPTHIPLQCCANDPKEFHEHKSRHVDKGACYSGVHVGCARWDPSNSPEYRRHYFFPGIQGQKEGMHSSPVNEIYCRRHAREVHENAPKRQAKREAATNYVPIVEAAGSIAAAPIVVTPTSSAFAPVQRQSSLPGTRPGASLSPAQSDSLGHHPHHDENKQNERPEKGCFYEIKDDVVQKIRRARRRGDDIVQATRQVKEHWGAPDQRKLMGMTKADFSAVWKRVREVVEGMPELQEATGASIGNESNETEDDGTNIREEPKSNRWSSIWEPGGTFEFGNWDTFEFVDEKR